MFWMGTHETSWLYRTDVRVPLFVSRCRFDRLKTLPRASSPWALDSGGFTEIRKYGRWTLNATEYASLVRRYITEIGMLKWAAPQDWMVEPGMLAKSGLTVLDHQRLTVANLVELRLIAPELPIIPAIQGQTLSDYHHIVDLYGEAGVDLRLEPLVGLGSVCRRQHSAEIGEIVSSLNERGLRLHGFGCKTAAVKRYGHLLTSADSMAWSRGGRSRGTCDHYKSRCANCLHWALDWRADILRHIAAVETGPDPVVYPVEVAPGEGNGHAHHEAS